MLFLLSGLFPSTNKRKKIRMNTCNMTSCLVELHIIAQHHCSRIFIYIYECMYKYSAQHCVVTDNIIMASLIWFLLLLLWYDNGASLPCCALYERRGWGMRQHVYLFLEWVVVQMDGRVDGGLDMSKAPSKHIETSTQNTSTPDPPLNLDSHVIAIIKMLCWRRVKVALVAWWPYHMKRYSHAHNV